MWTDLAVFTYLGLFVGAGARSFYRNRQPLRILSTLLLGVAGALLGGVASWEAWPQVDDEFPTGALVLSILGALLALMLAASMAYARRLREPA